MAAPVRALLLGTGAPSWALYFVALSALFYWVLPDGTSGLVGVLAAILATVRTELNGHRARVERLEARRVGPPGSADAPERPSPSR